MSNFNLIMYREPNRTNFGDELSSIILKYLMNRYNTKLEFILNQNCKINVCFIGSLISWSNLNYNNLYILGSGVRTENDKIIKNRNMTIFSVRGPLSKLYLEKFGYSVPNIYGDPALLLPKFYTPKYVDICKDKIGVVGHLTNFHKYKNLPNNFILINPTWIWSEVIDHITSCNLILSSSLHGLIISDAYNIPNIWLNEFALNEGTFKFKDYFLSQNRDIVSISCIKDFKNVEPYTGGNIIDLYKVENAFIKMCKYMDK